MTLWQQQLSGKLLTLKPLRDEDFESLFQVSSDPLIWEQHPDPDRYKREVFQGFFDSAIECKIGNKGGAFAAYDNATGKMIGSSRFCDYNPAESSIEVGYTFLSRDCWGKKYNWEMKSLMLNYAFEFVDKVFFFVGANNMRSRTAMGRIGGQEWGTELRKRLNGIMHQSVIYLITKNHWQQFSRGDL